MLTFSFNKKVTNSIPLIPLLVIKPKRRISGHLKHTHLRTTLSKINHLQCKKQKLILIVTFIALLKRMQNQNKQIYSTHLVFQQVHFGARSASNSTTKAANKMNKGTNSKNLGRKLIQKRLCAKSAKRDFLTKKKQKC